MRKIKNLSGERFGRLLVDNIDTSKKRTYWICKCDCGNTVSVRADSLVSGTTTSCGCYFKEVGLKKSKNKKYNEFEIIDNVCVIKTFKNEYIKIDIDDYDKVKKYCWSINSLGYPFARCMEKDIPILMHRLILNAKNGDIVDHKNHDTLDNRKENLRICTQYENMANQKLSSRNTSGHKGVYWDKSKNKWNVKIGYKNKSLNIGYYENIFDAIEARLEAEEKYFGEFSYYKSVN